MTVRSIRSLAPRRRSVALGCIVVLLSGCGGGATQPSETAPTSLAVVAPSPAGPSSPALAVASPLPVPSAGPGLDGGAAATPSPGVVGPPATPPAREARLDPPAHPGPFTIDLFRRGDFVSEARTDWCVPAAIQMMANLIDGPRSRSLPSQRVLDREARALSSPRLVGLGSEPQGWAGVLNALGDGPYVVVARPTFRDAIATAARALRLTGRPVGLLVWRGAHAWVMSGFEATADPAWSADFRVTAVRILDPWYPRRVSAWGRTRAPDARIGLAALARNLVRWHRPTVRYAELDGRFVLVLPVVAAGDR